MGLFGRGLSDDLIGGFGACENQWIPWITLVLLVVCWTVKVPYFRLFIVATGCPSQQRPQKTVKCYGGQCKDTGRNY